MGEPEKIERVRVTSLDEMLGIPLRVLDDGFVRVMDYMGSDESIVQAARVSYGRGTKRLHEDEGLIRYLMRHRHTTPFEMCELKLHLRVPMDCWRQWIRHRTANVNEYSTRYSEAIGAMQKTDPKGWREQLAGARQGSGGAIAGEVGEVLSRRERELHEIATTVYQERLSAGVAREQARKDLPLSTYTEAYWKIDLHNLLHFLSLRMDESAQQEIRSYANVIGREVVSKWCPITWQSFLDYQLNATTLSAIEISIVASLSRGDVSAATRLAERYGLVAADSANVKPNRERRELEEKLDRLGLPIPWADRRR